jgi:hypothetical protein
MANDVFYLVECRSFFGRPQEEARRIFRDFVGSLNIYSAKPPEVRPAIPVSVGEI